MNEAEKTLSYDLTGYDHRSVCRMFGRRISGHLGLHPRIAFILLLCAYVVMVIAAKRFGWRGSPWLPYAFLIVGIMLYLTLARRRAARLWQRVSASPLRTGQTNLSVSDAGITVENAFVHVFLRWTGMQDVVTGANGLLIQVADMDYFPIPASAFSRSEDQEKFRVQMRARIAEAKGAIA